MFQRAETMPDLQVDLMSRLNTPDEGLLIDSMCYVNSKLVVIDIHVENLLTKLKCMTVQAAY